ncbi:MAG: hypothetical protein QOG53_2594 [Frankiales bacterium]|jgi:GNAT superfamily N-acetyltransferase|nr:hypothetical protein [Frankiales bacterium]
MTAVLPDHEAWLTRAGRVHVRGGRSEDVAATRSLHERLSPWSRYLRYFTGAPNVERSIGRLLRPPDETHETVIALIDREIVAVACYERLDDPRLAEVAFLVDEGHHGQGLATLLLAELVNVARARGVHRFVAEVLPSNSGMLSVFRDIGLRTEVSSGTDSVHIEIPLDDEPWALHGWPDLAQSVLDPSRVREHSGATRRNRPC